MKLIRRLIGAVLVMGSIAVFSSCSNDNPGPNPKPDVLENDYHYDIWVGIGQHGGRVHAAQSLVQSVNSLEAGQPMIDFEGKGVEVSQTITMESAYKDEYYYQVPVSEDRFAKYMIKDNKLTPVAQVPFGQNTYSARKYCHVWTSDNTLVIVAANGKADEIIWTKLNPDNMTIIAEGKLAIAVPEHCKAFTTSGNLAYRPADNKLFYFYAGKTKAGMGAVSYPIHVAMIDASTMAVEADHETSLAAELVGPAYGDLTQNMVMLDDEQNIYLSCFTGKEKNEKSFVLKIPAGQSDFDSSYNAFTNNGRVYSMKYIGKNKALMFVREDEVGIKLDEYCHFYYIVDLKTGEKQQLAYNGQPVPASSGRYTPRMEVGFGKAFIGVNTEHANPCVYIYDLATNSVTKGVEIKEGYYFDQIRLLKNVK